MFNKRKMKLPKGEIIPLCIDFHFINVFGDVDNVKIVECFLSDYLELPIEDVMGNVQILPRDLPIKSKGEKSMQVDLLLKLGRKKINIEISTSDPYKNKKERDFVYACKIHGSNLLYSDNDYSDISDTLQIRFNNFYCNNGKIKRTYVFQSADDDHLEYTRKLIVDVIDLAFATKIKYNKSEEKIRKWCRILTTKSMDELEKIVGEDFMSKEARKKLLMEVRSNSRDDEMVYIYTGLSKQEMEMNTVKVMAERDKQKAIEEAERKSQKAIEEAERKSQKAIEEAERKNHKTIIRLKKENQKAIDNITQKSLKREEKKLNDQKIESAKRMLNENLDINLISRVVGLSEKDILALK